MIGSDMIRGYTDIMILALLLNGESYGYEISKKIRTITEEKYALKETTLYSAFTRLEKNRFIFSYPGEQTHGKKRTYYQITPQGQQYYSDKCEEWELTKEVVDKFIRKVERNGYN